MGEIDTFGMIKKTQVSLRGKPVGRDVNIDSCESVYVSGKISDDTILHIVNNKKKIDFVCRGLREMGFAVLNPVELHNAHTIKPWHEYMRIDFKMLLAMEVSAIVALDNWDESNGAISELFMALIIGLPIFDTNLNNITCKVLESMTPELLGKVVLSLTERSDDF